MVALTLHPNPVPLRMDPDGSIRVGNSRVLLPVLINDYRDWGWSAEQLAEQYPTISLAEAHGVLAYYLSHWVEVDAYVDEWNSQGQRTQSEWLRTPPAQALRAKVNAARAAKAGS